MTSQRSDDAAGESAVGVAARRVAYEALQRIDEKGAYANLVLSPILERSELVDRDRRFVTELVYGTTRMARACDYLVDRFLMREVDPPVRTLLRLGAYQLHFLKTPPHAAVSATVELAPKKVRGFVNAILRRVSEAETTWPDTGTELSYPDWIVELLRAEHGDADAVAMLRQMNQPPKVTERPDGYVQDLASQWVVEAVEAKEHMVVFDMCAAPGGKTTALAASGALVVAGDRKRSRVRLVSGNAERTGASRVAVIVADGSAPPVKPRSFHRVLVDAPCSGIGVLRRRADARWRLEPEAPARLAELQRTLLAAAAELVAPDGVLVYSVCTVTKVETLDVAASVPDGFVPLALPEGDRWRPWGDGGLLLPHDHDTDGMAIFRWRRDAT